MHIFLVNDDGYGAKGIVALMNAAVKRGHEVTLVAPETQQSAKSHCFTLREPMLLKEYPLPYENCKAYSLAGSPADCVRIGLQCVAAKPVDVVISGINNGTNSGIAVHYSGTVGAAFEGTFHDLPSIATSIHLAAAQEQIDALADYTIEKAEKIVKLKLPHCTFLNINAPKDPWIGEKICPLDEAYFRDSYVGTDTPRKQTCYWFVPEETLDPFTEGTDNDWLEKGYLTLTLVGTYISYPESTYRSLGL